MSLLRFYTKRVTLSLKMAMKNIILPLNYLTKHLKQESELRKEGKSDTRSEIVTKWYHDRCCENSGIKELNDLKNTKSIGKIVTKWLLS